MIQSRIYDFTCAAGGAFPMLVQGDYVRIMTAAGAVELQTDAYRLGPLMPGQGQANAPYTRLTIVDRSGAPNAGTILVAGSDFVDNRINGEVSIIDIEQLRAKAGALFSAGAACGTSGANISLCQLWNPAASGKRFIVTGLSGSASTTGAGINIYTNAAALAVDQTATRAANKLAGAAIGVGKIMIDQIPALPVMANNYLQYFYTAAYQLFEWKPVGAVVLPPGAGLVIATGTINTALTANIEWFEESV